MLGKRLLGRLVTKGFVFYTENKSRISGKRFYCAALAGESSYNICINSDMTVSCNCQDHDGTGILGNFSTSSMQEIFDSQTAKAFRKSLSQGRLPILQCAFCPELQVLSENEAAKKVTSYSIPTRGLMVETTVLCNLRCLSCDRTIQDRRDKKIMTLDDITRIAGYLSENKVEKVVLHNLGEPFLTPQIGKILAILRESNPKLFIRLSTNMLALDTDKKREAAMLLNHITVSLDGITTPMVLKYQHGGDFEKAFCNMRYLVDYRKKKEMQEPLITWQYLLFNWNDSAAKIKKAIQLAESAGVDNIRFVPTNSPLGGYSWRYALGGYCRQIGSDDGSGRKVIFSNNKGSSD